MCALQCSLSVVTFTTPGLPLLPAPPPSPLCDVQCSLLVHLQSATWTFHCVACNIMCSVYSAQCISTLCAVCSVLLPSGGIIASNTNQTSSGSLRIIGQLDLFSRRIIGRKIMAASKYQTARKWDTGHYGSKEVPGVHGQKGDFPKNYKSI